MRLLGRKQTEWWGRCSDGPDDGHVLPPEVCEDAAFPDKGHFAHGVKSDFEMGR